MALEQNRGRRRPHSELNRNTTEKNSENTISGEERRKAPIVTLPEEKKEGKRRIEHLDILQVNTPKDIQEELDEVYSKKEKKKKSRWKKILLLSVIEILTLVFIFCTAYIVRYMNIKPEKNQQE